MSWHWLDIRQRIKAKSSRTHRAKERCLCMRSLNASEGTPVLVFVNAGEGMPMYGFLNASEGTFRWYTFINV